MSAAPAFAASTALFQVTAERGNFGGPQRLRLVISSDPSGIAISGITVTYNGLPVTGSPASGTTTVVWTSDANISNNSTGSVTFTAGTRIVTLSFSIG